MIAVATQNRKDNFFERTVWVLFLVIGVIYLIIAVLGIIWGIDGDPAALESTTGMTPAKLKAQDPVIYRSIDQSARSWAKQDAVMGLMLSAIAVFSLRRGDRWAWFTMWLHPFSFMITVYLSLANRLPGESLAPRFYSGSLFTVLTIVWLALSYRKYLSHGKGG